jgi:hypothetical protein
MIRSGPGYVENGPWGRFREVPVQATSRWPSCVSNAGRAEWTAIRLGLEGSKT